MIGRHYLEPLFEPRTVALVGASENAQKVGGRVLENLLTGGFAGDVLAVNPRHRRVRGLGCVASYRDLDCVPDLAIVAIPAAAVPGVIDECGRKGTRHAVVMSAGFADAGPEGAKLERAMLEAARRHGVRILGPNCLGLTRPALGLNATFARAAMLPGTLALVSQSGAVCTAMLDWALPRGIGFSSVVSLGASSDVDFGEAIDYFAADPATEHILLYIEGVRDGRRLVGSLRAAARAKPVIVMKVGRHPAGSRAAVSHTGAIVGRDDIFDAVVRRTGAVRVQTLPQLVAAAQALAAHVHPAGERLAIVTNGGGPGVIAADRAADLAVPLATLSPATLERLRPALPPTWSHGNPLDLIGDAGPDRYAAALQACLGDDGVDGVIVMLTPQAMTDPANVAAAVVAAACGATKPLLACWMGEASVAASRDILRRGGVATFDDPEIAVETFSHVAAFYRNQRALLQVPGPLAHREEPDVERARAIVRRALAEGRGLLSATESKELLAAFRVPVAPMISSPRARELMAGIVRDPIFGPAITFGAGGIGVEVLRDRAVALPPLNAALVEDMIARTRVSAMLGAFRNLPAVDRAALDALLLRLSEIACELPEVVELDVNPVFADDRGVIALDARVVVEARGDARPYAHLAIAPYPSSLETTLRIRDGSTVLLRPIRPEDAAIETRFIERLSPATMRRRFLGALRELSPAMLARFTQIDYDREMAFVATVHEQAERVIAVGRYVTLPDARTCEYAIVVDDAWQGRGLGRAMVERLIGVARASGLVTMIGLVSRENDAMLALCRKLGFVEGAEPGEPQVRRVTLALSPE